MTDKSYGKNTAEIFQKLLGQIFNPLTMIQLLLDLNVDFPSWFIPSKIWKSWRNRYTRLYLLQCCVENIPNVMLIEVFQITLYMYMLWFITVFISPSTPSKNCKADPRFSPSQWETSLQSNAVPHWLGANLESAMKCPWFDIIYCCASGECLIYAPCWVIGVCIIIVSILDVAGDPKRPLPANISNDSVV